MFQGVVDRFLRVGADIVVRGWAIDETGRPVSDLDLQVGDRVYPMDVRSEPRPDVARAVPKAQIDCGFEGRLAMADLHGLPTVDAHCVVRYRRNGRELGRRIRLASIGNAPEISVPSTPAMPASAVSQLSLHLRKALVYLEYGTGGSTKLACSAGASQVVAVESDRQWMLAVEADLRRAGVADERVRFLHADIGPTKEWGFPVGETHVKSWHDYPLGAWRYMAEQGLSPDLILIDGRFRRACFLASLVHAKPGTRILFDDYLDRPHYHSVERFVRRERTFDRVAEFVRPAEIDANAVWSDLVEAVMDVR